MTSNKEILSLINQILNSTVNDELALECWAQTDNG
jgi:hypothetical protein